MPVSSRGAWLLVRVTMKSGLTGLGHASHGGRDEVRASPVGNIAAAHVCTSIPHALILECSFGEVDWREQIVEPAEQLANGVLTVSSHPGLGITLTRSWSKST